MCSYYTQAVDTHQVEAVEVAAALVVEEEEDEVGVEKAVVERVVVV
jgi:hypothetical protein